MPSNPMAAHATDAAPAEKPSRQTGDHTPPANTSKRPEASNEGAPSCDMSRTLPAGTTLAPFSLPQYTAESDAWSAQAASGADQWQSATASSPPAHDRPFIATELPGAPQALDPA